MLLEDYFLKTNRTGPPLRIGVMIDSPLVMRQFANIIESIQKSNFARIVLQISPKTQAPELAARKSFVRRFMRRLTEPALRRRLMFEAVERLDWRVHSDLVHIFGPVSVAAQLADVPTMQVDPIQTGFVDRFSGEDIATIRGYQLDVLLRFGFRILRGEILQAAKQGVWSFHHGDNAYYRGSVPQFWELYERNELTGALLQVLNDSLDDGLVLAKVVTATVPGWSTMVNRIAPYQSSQALVLQKMRQLHEDGWDALKSTAPKMEPYQGKRRIYSVPSNWEMTKFMAREVARRVSLRTHNILTSRSRGLPLWRVGIRKRELQNAWEGGWDNWHWVRAPAGHYYADPMLWENNGRTYLFVEDYIESEARGVIAVAEIGANGMPGEFTTIISRPYHLSFPYIFERDGAVFMIPESKAGKCIELLRATDFPLKWQTERVLLDVGGVDTVLHRHSDGREFLFTGIADAAGAQVSLCIYHAASLWSEWRLHPASPVSCDVRYSRNAGPIVVHPELGPIRISQDGSVFYGRRMHFHAIDKLDEQHYVERRIGTRSHDSVPGALGVHTYGFSQTWEVTDAFMPDRLHWS